MVFPHCRKSAVTSWVSSVVQPDVRTDLSVHPKALVSSFQVNSTESRPRPNARSDEAYVDPLTTTAS